MSSTQISKDIANTVLSLKDGLKEAWKKEDERMEGRDSEENPEEGDELERQGADSS